MACRERPGPGLTPFGHGERARFLIGYCRLETEREYAHRLAGEASPIWREARSGGRGPLMGQ